MLPPGTLDHRDGNADVDDLHDEAARSSHYNQLWKLAWRRRRRWESEQVLQKQ